MHAIPLLLAAALAGPPARAEGAPAPEDLALRALARLAAGEPTAGDVQAAARRAEASGDPTSLPGRGRTAALLPRLTAEYRYGESTTHTLGLQGSGEVDYARFAPGSSILVRATWDLGELLSPPGELAALAAAADRARRRDEAVRRATALYFERARLRLALVLDPPATPRAWAEAEIEIDRVTAELDALTGGLYAGRDR
ncbi:MAG TPA: hypothetical protein VLS93_04570 [Anaeromyxobacteraceae bacterium]|nr:hypothetical protein [Anaeromyxobacteraceae bacterium]